MESNCVCRCSYAEFLSRRIFGPLAMKDSGAIAQPPATSGMIASAYTSQEGKWIDISYSPLNFMVGHDGVISTLEDLRRWLTATERGKLLRRKYRSAMFATGHTNDGKPTQYGFGWRLADLNGAPVFQHEGCWSGFRNGVVRSAGNRLSAVVLTNAADNAEFWNCDEMLTLARELLRRGLHGELTVPAGSVRGKSLP